MSALGSLRQLIDLHHDRLRASVPADRDAAVLAILRARARVTIAPSPNLITGQDLHDLGGNKALRLCLEAGGEGGLVPAESVESLERWAETLLTECARLAEAEMVLGHCETGFMQMAGGESGSFDCWITTKLMPASWREREDIDWWAKWLAGRVERDMRAASSTDDHGMGKRYGELSSARLAAMEYQLGLPPEATLGGCTVATYRNVLRCLIARALRGRDKDEQVLVRGRRDLVDEITAEISLDSGTVSRAVEALTVDGGNAAWHAAVPAVAPAPVVRLGPDRLALSVHGLSTEPLFFLARELRRRDAQEYHNVAHFREDAFRDDLYELFRDKRFVTSPARIKLRRADGDIHTDIDAAVFDRKTGTLGVFELKAQDPFARSTDELMRQRDNMLYANRQVSGVMTWLNRHGGDEILRRFDARTARTFRVQKVYPFVLGRYLAHFGSGPEPDRRAAWGTWPQVLRLLDGQPAGGSKSNLIFTLYSSLRKDEPLVRVMSDPEPPAIEIGDAVVRVYPSYAAYRERGAGSPG
ncbi:MAG TPA: hypothetical protein VD789_03250 [Thermomicrobiales bacterium]|nr:hypothetical protein [Thermomicrobiales bacterium]